MAASQLLHQHSSSEPSEAQSSAEPLASTKTQREWSPVTPIRDELKVIGFYPVRQQLDLNCNTPVVQKQRLS